MTEREEEAGIVSVTSSDFLLCVFFALPDVVRCGAGEKIIRQKTGTEKGEESGEKMLSLFFRPPRINGAAFQTQFTRFLLLCEGKKVHFRPTQNRVTLKGTSFFFFFL